MNTLAGGSLRRRTRAALLLAGLLALLAVPATADAHRLSGKRAMKAAKASSNTFAGQIHGSASSDGGTRHVLRYSWGPCTRRSNHSWTCTIGNTGDVIYPVDPPQPFECSRKVRVQYASSTSSKLVVKNVGGRTCTR